MTTIRKLVLLLVAAGSVLSAQAQTGQSDADRRMRNRTEAMERRMKMDREGSTSVAPAVTWHHGQRAVHGRHMHHGRVHMRHHHPHRHPVR